MDALTSGSEVRSNRERRAPSGDGAMVAASRDVGNARDLATPIRRDEFLNRGQVVREHRRTLRALEQIGKVRDSASYLAANLERAPWLMVPLIGGRLDNVDTATGAGGWGSLLPAVWSFMLALRTRGLGSAWTTIHLMLDGERTAAEVLGIPYDKYTQGGIFPVAYTKGTDFKPADRLPLSEVLHWERFGG